MEYSNVSKFSTNSQESGESKVERLGEVDLISIVFLYRDDTWMLYPMYTTYDSPQKQFVS